MKTIKKQYHLDPMGFYLDTDRDIVVIGCGAGGGTAAQFARKTDRKTSITIFEQGEYPQYSKCGLPYAISKTILRMTDLIEFSEDWFKKQKIDLMLNTKVEKIDVKNQIVYAKKGNLTIEKSYGSLIICTGAKPIIPSIQNIKNNGKLIRGVFVLRTIDDAKLIVYNAKKGDNAVIIGAGLIGLEMAESLHKIGMKVSIVEALPNILGNNFDEDISKIVYDEIAKHISLFTNHLASRVESKNGKISSVSIKNNNIGKEKTLNADLLIVAAGTKPEISLAQEVGCKIGGTGGIVVNEKSETSMKNIYAVGDCTEYIDFVTRKPVPVGLGSIAVRQGIAAGVNAAGGNYKLPSGVLQTCTSEFFGLEIAAVGPISNHLKDHSIVTGRFNGSSLPEYYPGGKPITLKVLVDEKTGKILGAQGIGDKAAQRINTFAAGILGELDVETMRKLETAYAPPIAPTLDVVTLVCDVVAMKLNRK